MIRRFRDLASREPGSVLAGLFALALAGFYLANSLAQVVVSILEQRFGSRDGPLEFHIGHTTIDYAEPLTAAIALALLGLALYWVYRLANPGMQTCPDCLSEIPREAIVCRYCTSQVGEVSDT
jgi:hypothetical protein